MEKGQKDNKEGEELGKWRMAEEESMFKAWEDKLRKVKAELEESRGQVVDLQGQVVDLQGQVTYLQVG